MANENKRKVLCPECEKEVDITRDDEGDDIGQCGSCGLDVGRVLTKRRYDRALKNMDEREEAEKKRTAPPKKKNFWS